MAHPATGLSIFTALNSGPNWSSAGIPPLSLQYLAEITKSYNDILCKYAKDGDFRPLI